jgi:hypothetical protein
MPLNSRSVANANVLTSHSIDVVDDGYSKCTVYIHKLTITYALYDQLDCKNYIAFGMLNLTHVQSVNAYSAY